MDFNYLFFNGRIASGKDTQAEIVNEYLPRSVIISPGKIYREAIAGTGEGGIFTDLINPYIEFINLGGLLPDEIIIRMLESTVEKKSLEGNNTFIFTGFPRTLNQLNEVDKWVKSDNVRSIFLCYAVLDQHSIHRSQYRMSSADSPRAEDNIESVKARLSGYKIFTEPVLKRLLHENRLEIIKSNRSIEEIAQCTRQLLTEKYGFEYRPFVNDVSLLAEASNFFMRR